MKEIICALRTARWESRCANGGTNRRFRRGQRSRIPILSDERSPVWVYGLGVDKRVLPTEETTRFLVIDIEEEAL